MTGAVLILAGTAAVACLVGWLRSEACFRGAYRRLESAALELEAAENARRDLQARMDALPLVHLTLNGSAEESERTLH